MLGKAILIVGIIVLISAILSKKWAAAPWILAVGVVYVLLKFLNKDGDEPDALGGDKDEALAQDIAQGMDDKEDKLKSKPATRFAITP